MPSSTAVSAAPCDSPAVSHRNTGPSFHVADGHSGDHGREDDEPRRSEQRRAVRDAAGTAGEHEDEDPDGGEHRGRRPAPPQDAAASGAPRAGASLTSPAPSAPGATRCTAANAPPRTTAPTRPATRCSLPSGTRAARASTAAGQVTASGRRRATRSVALPATTSTPRPSHAGSHAARREPGGHRPPPARPRAPPAPGASAGRDEHPAPHPREQRPHRHPGERARRPRPARRPPPSTASVPMTTPSSLGSPSTRRHASPRDPVDASGGWGRRTEQRCARVRAAAGSAGNASMLPKPVSRARGQVPPGRRDGGLR